MLPAFLYVLCGNPNTPACVCISLQNSSQFLFQRHQNHTQQHHIRHNYSLKKPHCDRKCCFLTMQQPTPVIFPRRDRPQFYASFTCKESEFFNLLCLAMSFHKGIFSRDIEVCRSSMYQRVINMKILHKPQGYKYPSHFDLFQLVPQT